MCRAKNIILQIWVIYAFVLAGFPAGATVIEFGPNGTIKQVHKGVDYLSSARHLKSQPPFVIKKLNAFTDYDAIIEKYSKTYGVNKYLVKAVISVESSNNPNAVSPKNAQGLMQLIPDTAKRFGVQDVFDPEDNIEGGVKYLKFLLDRYDQDIELALAGYNAGEGAVDKYEGIPPYPETIDYVKKVSALFKP